MRKKREKKHDTRHFPLPLPQPASRPIFQLHRVDWGGGDKKGGTRRPMPTNFCPVTEDISCCACFEREKENLIRERGKKKKGGGTRGTPTSLKTLS